jgi:hypothetical protein
MSVKKYNFIYPHILFRHMKENTIQRCHGYFASDKEVCLQRSDDRGQRSEDQKI